MMVYIPLIFWGPLVANNNLVVVWDWNGTLVDDAFIFVDIMNGYLSEFSLPLISLSDYKNNFCFPVREYYKKLGFRLSIKEFEVLSVDFINRYKKNMLHPNLKNGVIDVLDFLKKNHCSQFILSAQEQTLLNFSLKHYGIKNYFDGVFGLNNNFAESKAALAKKKLAHVLARPVVFVGDTTHDFEVSSSVGGQCCLVSWGHNSLQRLKETKQPVVKNPKDLLFFMRNLLKTL